VIRTQIQITETQAKALRRRAAEEETSVAELVRRLVEDGLARGRRRGGEADRVRRALSIVGRFRSKGRDAAIEHDRELADAYKA